MIDPALKFTTAEIVAAAETLSRTSALELENLMLRNRMARFNMPDVTPLFPRPGTVE